MGTNVRQNIVTNGLAVHLDAGSRQSYPGSGTTWTDLSGNGNTGTLTNGPTFNAANQGSIVFDGSDDYVDCGGPSSGSATSDYTFGVWFNNDNFSEVKYPLVRGRDSFGLGWSLFIVVNTNGGAQAGVVYTVPSTVGISADSPSNTIQLNRWYNIVGIWTAGSNMKLYVNGQLITQTTITGTVLRSSTVGWVLNTINNTTFTSGLVATTTIYNRALSAQEVAQNYNATKTRFGLT